MNRVKGCRAAFHIEAHGIDHSVRSGDGIANVVTIGDIGPDRQHRPRCAGEQASRALGVPRGHAHGAPRREKPLNDAPAEKPGASEDRNDRRHRRPGLVARRGRSVLLFLHEGGTLNAWNEGRCLTPFATASQTPPVRACSAGSDGARRWSCIAAVILPKREGTMWRVLAFGGHWTT